MRRIEREPGQLHLLNNARAREGCMPSRLVVSRWPLGIVVLLFIAIFPLAGRLFAGQEGAGIIGGVRDESGAVMPGVTVTATSPALQLPQMITVTNQQGEYRLAPLPIGTYSVEYSLSGFQVVRREGVRLTVGFTARVDAVMRIATLKETITVTGASPVVDTTSSASATVLTRENLELIPTARNGLNAMLAQAPGVRPSLDVGGRTIMNTLQATSFGRSFGSYQIVEGVANTTWAQSQSGVMFDYTSTEEARVETVGHSAETPNPGLYLAVVVKSGSNQFHGGASYHGTNGRFEGNNIDEALASQGVTAPASLNLLDDLGGNVGGRIVRDKLWFWFGARNQRIDRDVLACLKPDGSPCTTERTVRHVTQKTTYQMTPTNRFIGFAQWHTAPGKGGGSRLSAWETQALNTGFRGSSKGEWQATKGHSLAASLQLGVWWSDNRDGLPSPLLSDKPSSLDLVTRVLTGNYFGAYDNVGQRWHTKGDVSWYKPGWFVGNHQFKGGFDHYISQANRLGLSQPFNYQLQFSRGVPSQIAVSNSPVTPDNRGHYLGLFAQDSWTIARRLTLNLGVRYAHDSAFIGEQCTEAAEPPGQVAYPAQCFPKLQMPIWNTVSPRLYAAYDLTGDGKTAVKGGWGRFPLMRGADDLLLVGRNVMSTTVYRWRDLNGNGDYDPGEVNLNPNGLDFVNRSLRDLDGEYANGVVNPNETQPWTDEYSLQFERELMKDFAIRVLGSYSRLLNQYRIENTLRPYSVYNIPIRNLDPGPDARVGTADDPGTLITYYDYPREYAGLAFQQPWVVNDPGANQTYRSFEVAASKRFSDRWTFMGSYTATKKNIPFPSSGAVRSGIQAVPLNPNSELFAADNTWDWQARFSGAYTLPADVVVSGNFEHRSGDPLARTALFTGGQQISSITLPVEPLGTSRLPNLNLLDLRVEKRFSLGTGQKVAVQLNIFNALNINSATAITLQSGPNYGRVTAIIPPQSAQFGVSYTF
jgi:hypothetical protein